MKILEVFGEPILNGGQEAFVVSFVKEIDSEQFHFDLLTPYEVHNDSYQDIVDKKGGQIYSFGFQFKKDKGRLQIFKCFRAFLKTNRYEVVHINSGSTFFLAMACYIAKTSGVPKVIVHSHCSGNKENFKHMVIKRASAPIFTHYADEICACSLKAAQWKFSDSLIYDKLIIVKNGIDTTKFFYDSLKRDEIRKSMNIPQNTYVLGHVGRFTYEKNQKFLIDLFEKYAQVEKNSYLILVGDGENKEKLENYVQNRVDIRDKVLFVGNTKNVNDYLQVFDVFVFPSLYEGLPISAIEAESTGLPVLASDTITKDIAITDHIFFLPLSEEKKEWIVYLEKIKQDRGTRKSENQKISEAGYDVQNTIQTMKTLFLR